MAETVNCSIIGQTHATGNGTFGAYATTGNKYAGANSSSYYAYILQFQTGDFTGDCEKLDLNLSVKSMYHANLTLRYALATSDENKNSYRSTTSEVTDNNQIASGQFALNGLSTSAYRTHTLSIDTDALEPGTTYYLFLWGTNKSSGTNLDVTANHTVTVYFDPSFTVTVDHKLQNEDGSSTQFEQATYTIDAGTLYTPELRSPPSTNTTEGATFKAWKTDWSLIAEGVVGVDYVTVNEDLFVSVYYPLVEETGSYIHFKVNGSLVECEILRITGGEPVLQELFYKDNGQIIGI